MTQRPAIVIEGCAIVSADGMLADSSHAMPASLKFDADQKFFSETLERADLIVHGRNSYEDQPNSPSRRRIVLTRRIEALAADPHNPKATLWNPAGASFEDACARAGFRGGRVAIIGGTDVFGMFLDRYDTFFLSEVPNIRLPGGVPVFPGVPQDAPQDIMTRHGLKPDTTQTLDAAHGVTLTPWVRRA
jgi:dihydrofolate reductase